MEGVDCYTPPLKVREHDLLVVDPPRSAPAPMMLLPRLITTAILLLASPASSHQGEHFDESLTLTPLNSGHVIARFNLEAGTST